MSDLATTIHNERVKLTATMLNALAIATIAVGAIAPAVSFLTEPSPQRSGFALAGIAIACFSAGSALHLIARYWLGRMKS